MHVKPIYAQVVIDLPTPDDRTFDYRIPGRFLHDIQVGSIVLAPFAGGRRIGYVIGTSDSTAVEINRVKPIESLIEETPAFDDKTVELCRWIADKYLSSLAEAIKLALPPGRSRKLTQVVYLLKEPPTEFSAGLREFCDFLSAAGGAAEVAVLKKIFGSSVASRVAALIELGVAERCYEIGRPTVVEKKERFLLPHPGLRTEEVFALLDRAPKQRAILELLTEEGGKPISEVLLRTGSTSHQIRSLVSKGFVLVEERKSERLPGALYVEEDKNLLLTDEQENAVTEIGRSIEAEKHEVFLLHGITGSGKTEVYLRAITKALSCGKGAIVLVPEIALAPQMVARFRARFGDLVAVFHSALSDGERYDQWRGMRDGRYRIVVGARSALFAPLVDIGVIVVDEEHEGAYKQGRSPRYHTRDVAVERGRLVGASIILGSATPSLESRLKAGDGLFKPLVLSRRANDRPLPEIELVDMRKEPVRVGTRRTISRLLEERIRDSLDKGGKVILLLNRRGFANYLICPDCGFVPFCPGCAVSLNYHRVGHRLRCHHCGYSTAAPSVCPKCGSHRLFYKGAGTQRAEEEISALFPGTPLIRMDADTTRRKNAHQARLNAFRRAGGAILLGTQMIAKGLDFPDVVLVGVLDADTALYLPDFRAEERTYQLIMQVSGRAGRAQRLGKVVVQTHAPDNGAILSVLNGEYDSFFAGECRTRRELNYPPFSTIIRLLYAGPNAHRTADLCERAGRLLADCPGELLGPAPAPLVRIKGDYRYHILVKTVDADGSRAFIRANLNRLLPKGENKVSLVIDVDPAWIL